MATRVVSQHTNDSTLQQVEATALILEQATLQQQRIRDLGSTEQLGDMEVRRVKDKPSPGETKTKEKKPSMETHRGGTLFPMWKKETS